jgi:hypothetical protein
MSETRALTILVLPPCTGRLMRELRIKPDRDEVVGPDALITGDARSGSV